MPMGREIRSKGYEEEGQGPYVVDSKAGERGRNLQPTD